MLRGPMLSAVQRNLVDAYAVMRGYKAQRPVSEHVSILVMLMLALSRHERCPAILAGVAVTHWSTGPSLPAKPGEHPLHQIVSRVDPGVEVRLVPTVDVQHPRDVNPRHFSTYSRLPSDSHALLIDEPGRTEVTPNPPRQPFTRLARGECPCSSSRAGSRRTSAATWIFFTSFQAGIMTRLSARGWEATVRGVA